MSNNENNENMSRARRGSVGNAVFSSLFQRNSSIPNGSPSVIPPAAVNMNDPQRRRLSVSTLGLHGASPTSTSAPYHFRRASTSTNSESIDECAVEEDESGSPKTAPTTPFRRMSMGGPPRNFRSGSMAATGKTRATAPRSQGKSPISPGLCPRARSVAYSSSVQPTQSLKLAREEKANPLVEQTQFAWSEQLRNRAESSVSAPRPSFSFANGFGNSPPRGNNMQQHDRAKSAAEMPAPPAQSPPAPKPKQPERRKPDAFQERILKGDFYMD